MEEPEVSSLVVGGPTPNNSRNSWEQDESAWTASSRLVSEMGMSRVEKDLETLKHHLLPPSLHRGLT